MINGLWIVTWWCCSNIHRSNNSIETIDRDADQNITSEKNIFVRPWSLVWGRELTLNCSRWWPIRTTRTTRVRGESGLKKRERERRRNDFLVDIWFRMLMKRSSTIRWLVVSIELARLKKCQAIERSTHLNETRQSTADGAQTKRYATLFNNFTRDNNRSDQQIYADEEDGRISAFCCRYENRIVVQEC